MIITIKVNDNEARSDFPRVIAESQKGRRKYAVDNVKGAVLHAIAERPNVPSIIQFCVFGLCRVCGFETEDTEDDLCKPCEIKEFR